jgi:putative ABC transport system permease protein
MILRHLLVSWRNLRRNPGYALLNIAGLAMGLTVAIVITLWIDDELSFNKSFENYDCIAQLMVRGTNTSGTYVQWAASPPYAPAIREQFGDDFDHVLMFSQLRKRVLGTDKVSILKEGHFAEPGASEMLSLTMVEGSSLLSNANMILLSQSTATALFGQQSAAGKLMRLDNKFDVTIAGVYKDIPVNTDFADMHFLSTWELYITMNRSWMRLDDWRQNGYLAFAEIKEGHDFGSVSHKIKDVKLKHADPVEAKNHPQFFLHPMSKWRLYSDLEGDTETGRIKLVLMFATIGIFILVMACINFMNLATASSEKRAKEVGVKKTVGSSRFQLIIQFFTESVLISHLALIVAIITTFVVLPLFNKMTEKQMEIPFSSFPFWLCCIAFAILTGILAGSYPAFYLSSFQPGKMLKGKGMSSGSIILRRMLMIIQFSISTALIIGVVVVFRQVETGKQRTLGYDQEGLVWVTTQTDEIHQHIDAVRNELTSSGKVTDVAEALGPVTSGINAVVGGFDWTGNGPNNDIGFRCSWASPENGKTLDWRVVDGRDFDRSIPTDTASMILNEAAVRAMELTNPVGTLIRMNIYDESREYRVIGVVKDLLMESPYSPVRGTIYMVDNSADNVVNIRISEGTSFEQGIAEIQRVFLKYAPSSPFVYEFADVALSNKFREEQRVGKLAATFAGLAIFISMLGILGLASFVAEIRSKEIAIRKVLGATVASIWQLLSKEFVILSMVSCMVAIPLSWYYMNDWLQQFEIQTNLSWWIFFGGAFVTLLIMLITASYQTIRAAVVNPTKSLHS